MTNIADQEQPQLCVAFVKCCELLAAYGIRNIRSEYGECCEIDIDDQWHFAINPHDAPKKCARGVDVDPISIVVDFNGLPAGVLTPGGGAIVISARANEEALLVALDRAIQQKGGA